MKTKLTVLLAGVAVAICLLTLNFRRESLPPSPPGLRLSKPGLAPKTVEPKRGPRFAATLPQFEVTNISLSAGQVSLGWQNGSPPYQVMGSPSLHTASSWSEAGPPTMLQSQSFPVGKNALWKVQGAVPLLFINETNQPRLTWQTPLLDMSDSLQAFTLQKRSDAPPAGQTISDDAGWTLVSNPPANAISASDTSAPPQYYRLKETTANGVTIPYPVRSATGQISGSVTLAEALGVSGAQAVAIAANGDFVVTGYFSGTVNFDPSGATHTPSSVLTATSQFNMFIARYTSTGAYVWAVRFDQAVPASVIIDSFGDIYVAGYFMGPAVSVGGASMNSLTVYPSGTTTYAANGFIGKYSGNNGAFVWSIQVGSGSTVTGINKILIDPSHNIYFGGYTGNQRDASLALVPWHIVGTDGAAGPDMSNGAIQGGYVAKITSSGVVQGMWGRCCFNHDSGNQKINDMATDSSGNLYVAGHFAGQMDWSDSASGPYIFANGAGFAAKFDSSGNLVWQRLVGNANDVSSAFTLKLDSDGSLVVAGSFQATFSTDGGPTMTGQSYSTDGFMCRFDSSGVWKSQLLIAFPQASVIYVAVPFRFAPGSSGLYMTGTFGGTGVFGSTVIGRGDHSQNESFIARFKSSPGQSDDLSPLWVNECYANNGSVLLYDVANNGSKIVAIGTFTAPSQFGAKQLTNNGNDSALIVVSP